MAGQVNEPERALELLRAGADPAARNAWLRHMRAAVDTLELSPLHEAELWDYLERAAHSLQNSA